MAFDYLDPDGQPFDLLVNLNRRTDRNHDELIGMIRGIVADGIVHPKEVELLANWCMKYGV